MKVSIITVCLNSEKHLQSCFDSVRMQTWKDIELIVVDGKSTDGTPGIIHDNRDIIAYAISETDRGMYDAINKGLKCATGDIVGVLNSDDRFARSTTIEDIVHFFKEKEVDAIYGDLVFIDPEKENRISRIWYGKTYKRSLFRMGWMPAHPTFYIKRELMDKYGFYKNHYYTAADYEFMARYLFKYRCSAAYLKEVLVEMRVGGISNNSIKGRLRANRRDYLAMKENGIPFPFLTSILKPLSKLHQFRLFPNEMRLTVTYKATLNNTNTPVKKNGKRKHAV